jgi:peptide/nickel transport system permease protein
MASVWSRLARRKLTLAGVIVVAAIAFVALAAPWLAPRGPGEESLLARLLPPGAVAEGQHYTLGTDSLGRNLLTQIIWGARISLLIGVLAVALGGTAGLGAGVVSGYAGGKIDAVIMRLADVQLAFPSFLLALSVLAVLGPGLGNVIVVLAISDWVQYARVARGQTLSALQDEYVQAARALGAGHARIALRHILPNILPPIIVIASFSVARAIVAESSLSFLGLGVPPDLPTWGRLLAGGREYIREAWWVATFPGVALMVTALGINVVGDWLRDMWDPRARAG